MSEKNPDEHRRPTPRPPIPPLVTVTGPDRPNLFDKLCDWIDRLCEKKGGRR